MKAVKVVFPEKRQSLLQSFEIPDTLETNKILVKASASLISSGTEMSVYTGTHSGISDPDNRFAKFPFQPGYATAGVVMQTGTSVTNYKTGDHVFVQKPHASHFLCTEQELVPIPANLPLGNAPLARLASISLHGVRMANIHLGESALVVGQGLIGLFATFGARLEGARPLIAMDLDDSRLVLAKQLGATELLNPTRDSLDKVKNKVEHIILATPTGSIVQQALSWACPGAKVVLLGGVHGNIELDLYKTIHRKGLHLIGAHENGAPKTENPYFNWTMRNNLICMLKLMADAEFNVESLITQRCTSEGIPALFESAVLDPKSHLGMIIDWE